jgi:YesN/AraC family two-component response regulator
MTILIVDDEELAVRGILDGVRWDQLHFDKVLTARSYQDAVNIFSNTYVDILVSDIEMPGESGLQLIEYVNEHSPNTECIILTCHDEFDYARRAVGLNCMEYVLKPVRYQKLTEILRQAEERSAQRRRTEQIQHYGEQYIDSLAKETRSDPANALETAVQYIDGHLTEELSVRELAGVCFISADHLTRLFKKKFGVSESEYMQERRIRLAGELMRRQEMSISMVANKVGFGTYSYFTEQFKKFYGMTPREYQKQQQK